MIDILLYETNVTGVNKMLKDTFQNQMFFCGLLQSVLVKFLRKDTDKFKKISGKRKYKKLFMCGEEKKSMEQSKTN